MRKCIVLAFILLLAIYAWSQTPTANIYTDVSEYITLASQGVPDTTYFIFPDLESLDPWYDYNLTPNSNGCWALLFAPDSIEYHIAVPGDTPIEDSLTSYWYPVDVLTLNADVGKYKVHEIVPCFQPSCSTNIFHLLDWDAKVDTVLGSVQGSPIIYYEWVTDNMDTYRYPTDASECCPQFGPYDGIAVVNRYESLIPDKGMGLFIFFQVQ